jgi:hypothetical protein
MDPDTRDVPPTSNEDRSEWRYDHTGGAPMAAAHAFNEWVRGLPSNLDAGEELVTRASWPTWRQAAAEGSLTRLGQELTHLSTTIRYPAVEMAYAFAPIMHPDQDEPIAIEGKQSMWINVITLLLEDEQWKVHQVGEMLPPAAIGKTAYSW